jgi:hypothetical protein
MNASTNLGVLSAALYLFIIRYVCPVPHSIVVPIILMLSALAAYLASGVYSVTVGGVSVLLFLCCAIGGTVGSLSSVVMNPFLTKFEGDYITASRSGGSICIVMTALLAAVQSPGSPHPRFGTTYYMLVVAVLLSLPIFAFLHITRYGIGVRVETNGVRDRDPSGIQADAEDSSVFIRSRKGINEHPGDDGSVSKETEEDEGLSTRDRQESNETLEYYRDDTFLKTTNPLLQINGNGVIISSDNFQEKSSAHDGTDVFDGDKVNERGSGGGSGSGSVWDSGSPSTFLDCCIPSMYTDSPWMRKVAPLCAVMGFVNMNTWGIVTAVAPFAFKNVSTDSGAALLGRAYELGAVCLMLGDLSTALLRLPVHWAVTSFALLTSMIYVAAVPSPLLSFPSAGPLLVASFALGRFFEAHLVTGMYRIIASDFHPRDRENAARIVGVVDLVSTTIGSITSSVLVARYASC